MDGFDFSRPGGPERDRRELRSARILVTGGGGFIGSNLVEKFLAQDNEVVVLDDFSTGFRENLARFEHDPRFHLVVGDLRSEDDCRKAVDGVDFVLHEAALGSVPRSIENPIRSTDVNVRGFVTLMDAARKARVKRFVYASSSSAYGDEPNLPKVESRVGEPLSPYAASKRAGELAAASFHRVYGLETIGFRYFNVFGRRQNVRGPYAAVIPRFLGAMIRGERPVIHGDGSNSRDFTYIDNILRINELALLTDRPDAPGSVFNAACGERTDLNELFRSLRDALAEHLPEAADIEPEYGPRRAGDVPHSLASIDKARAVLGYEPVVRVAEGLRRTVAWFWENRRVFDGEAF